MRARQTRKIKLGALLGSLILVQILAQIWGHSGKMNSAQAAEPLPSLLSQVARTGKLTAGTRTDAAPFAFRTPDGEWRGYSVDLLERIRATLQRELRRPVELELVDADTDSLTLVSQGSVDIVCGSTSISPSRELQVNFSVGYFVTGTQLLINTENRLGTEFRIGVIAGTTNQQLMRRSYPLAQFVTVNNRAMGLTALQNQRVDALASDGVLLEAMRLSLIDPASPEASPYAVFPDAPLDEEYYACMLPQGDEEFRQAVNRSLLDFMRGALAQKPAEQNILNTWFGEAGKVPIGSSGMIRLLDYFQKQIDLQNPPSNPLPSAPLPSP
ncbi:MAG: amino acid ABC transporter substrate-binding protein [Pegethrix bostrychoides GSE-TBD4-15B]|jgi:polar amino acid transport system substrate-binding protein|uniref:Amino acid ABC transporter substrate-binding protein n=1 Tax=Pegethrix bostrychoides GSE-TBD4-15B TaxID=2839662 RepID=A0A951PGK1_9CYAN|nr:amino acid ABC transporter substrate-binding protein [Pegethrix bostrychoides GSE-TBD4-15B]